MPILPTSITFEFRDCLNLLRKFKQSPSLRTNYFISTFPVSLPVPIITTLFSVVNGPE